MSGVKTQQAERDFFKELGLFLRKMRELQGMSQHDIAEYMGVSFQQVQKYESGNNRLSVYGLLEYANALELNPSKFFENDFPNAQCRVLEPRSVRKKLSDIRSILSDIEREIMKKK